MTSEEVKCCSLEILSYIDCVCKANNLRYYLCAGTLLGAIRHHGFIPWDDDIDIMMPRNDYEKLFSIMNDTGSYAALNGANTKNFPYAFGKIVDNRTIKKEPIRYSCQVIGVDIDVFPLDNFPDSEKESLTFLKEIEHCQRLVSRRISAYKIEPSLNKTITRNCKIFVNRLAEFFGSPDINDVVSEFSVLAQRYNTQSTCHCGISTLYHYGMGERYRKLIFDGTVYVSFEGKDYPAPSGYDEYLTGMYGSDYMQSPPLEKRRTHHFYKAYWK